MCPIMPYPRMRTGNPGSGNYLIDKVSDTVFNAYLVTGAGTGPSPYEVSNTAITLTGMDLAAYESLPSPTRAQFVPISALGEMATLFDRPVQCEPDKCSKS